MLTRILRTFTQSPDGKLWGIPIGTDLDIKQRYNFAGTMPNTTPATEKMIAYGSQIGKGASFKFTGDLNGKQLILTDSTATVATVKTITFTRSSFANPQVPTLAEIFAAINAVLSVDGTPTVASSGAKGNLVITAAATSASGVLTIGAGSANQLLGFPEDGVTVKIDNAVGVSFIFPATMNDEILYSRTPRVQVTDLTVATLVKTHVTNWTAVWTPSTRTLLIAGANVTRACAITVEI
jgi:hypothetical protein